MEAKYEVVLIKPNYPHDQYTHVLRAPQFAFGTENKCFKTLPEASSLLMELHIYFEHKTEIQQYTLQIIEENLNHIPAEK